MSKFQKGLTKGKSSIYKAFGMIDGAEDSKEFTEQNAKFKDLQLHYKRILDLNKKYQQAFIQLSQIENELAQEIIDYSQNIKEEQEVSLILQTLGASLQYISTSRQKTVTNTNEAFFENVAELSKEMERCKEAKELYRQHKLEYELLEKKGGLKTEDQKKDMESYRKLTMDHFEYNTKRRNLHYTSFVQNLILCYKRGNEERESIFDQIREFLIPRPVPKIEVPRLINKDLKNQLMIFGAEFEDIVKRKDEGGPCPKVFQALVDYLDKRAIDVQGIFRISGTENEVRKIQEIYDDAKTFDLEKYEDVNVIASLFKLLLRKQPTPLLTFELYQQFLSTSTMDENQRLKKFIELISGLPPVKKYSLGVLLELLYKISLNSKNNMMTPGNLAICFGPNILRGKDLNPLDIAKDNNKIISCVESMIELYPKIQDIFKKDDVKKKQEEKFKVIDLDDVESQIKATYRVLKDYSEIQPPIHSYPINLLFCFTNIFCTKELPFEIWNDTEPFFNCTGSIKRDDIVIIEESTFFNTPLTIKVKMPLKNVQMTKTFDLTYGTCFLVEYEHDEMRIIQSLTPTIVN